MKIRSEWSGFVSTILLTVPDRERKTVEENDGKLLRVLVPSVGLSEWQASFAQRSAVSESCHTFWSNEMTRHCFHVHLDTDQIFGLLFQRLVHFST